MKMNNSQNARLPHQVSRTIIFLLVLSFVFFMFQVTALLWIEQSVMEVPQTSFMLKQEVAPVNVADPISFPIYSSNEYTGFPKARKRMIYDLTSDPAVHLTYSEVFKSENVMKDGKTGKCRIGVLASFKNAYVGICGSVTSTEGTFLWYDFEHGNFHSDFCAKLYWDMYGGIESLWEPHRSTFTNNEFLINTLTGMKTSERPPSKGFISDMFSLSRGLLPRATKHVLASSTVNRTLLVDLFDLTEVDANPQCPVKPIKLIPVLFTWGATFPHLIKDLLPRLVFALPLFEKDPSTKFLLPEGSNKHLLLDLLDIDVSRVIYVGKGPDYKMSLYNADFPVIYFAEEIILPSCWPGPQTTGHYSKEMYHNARKRIVQTLPAHNDTNDLIIYATRTGGYNNARRIRNEQELLIQLRKAFGSRLVEFIGVDHTLKESFSLFSRAQVILGPHGGAFYNIIASRPGTWVFEFSPDDYGRDEVRLLSAKLGLEHFRVLKEGMTRKESFGDVPVLWTVQAVKLILDGKESMVDPLDNEMKGWKVSILKQQK